MNKLPSFEKFVIFALKLLLLRLICIIFFLSFVSIGFSQTYVGTGSIYSSAFNGKRTFSGQVYKPQQVSAAHPWLPMGTKILVTNLKNNKKVTVVINDRMGKSSGFLLDMSTAAAKMIGLSARQGITRIKIKILG